MSQESFSHIADSGGAARWMFDHRAMACDWQLWIEHGSKSYARQAALAVFEEVDRLEEELSRFIPSSDVARINDHPVGRPLRIGPDCFGCLALAEQLRQATDGAFDVRVGAWVDRSLRRVSESAEQSVAELPELVIDVARRTVTRLTEITRVDLGGVGKGFAIDRGVDLLREWGIQRAILHSGQSTVFGLADAGSGWDMLIRNPTPGAADIRLTLVNGALAGSGRDHHGPHIVDPRTGCAVQGPVAAWAAASSAAVADVWSTALMVLGGCWIKQSPSQSIAACVLEDEELAFSAAWGELWRAS